MRPTSIVVAGAGSSAAVKENGGIEFRSATSLSFNQTFISAYTNYLVFVGMNSSVDSFTSLRFRSNNVDEAAANYVYQELNTDNTTISAARGTAQTGAVFASSSSTAMSMSTVYIYGAPIAKRTILRRIGMTGQNGARTGESANYHSLQVAYDGFTIYPNTGTIAGNIAIYAFAE
jgi:hypothetical protein